MNDCEICPLILVFIALVSGKVDLEDKRTKKIAEVEELAILFQFKPPKTSRNEQLQSYWLYLAILEPMHCNNKAL